jgi:hypothetical protein
MQSLQLGDEAPPDRVRILIRCWVKCEGRLREAKRGQAEPVQDLVHVRRSRNRKGLLDDGLGVRQLGKLEDGEGVCEYF